MTGTAFVVLAAGAARRFGSGKLDAILGAKALGLWATAAVEAVEPRHRFIVTPAHRPAFVGHLAGWTVIENPQAERGIGTSVRAAIAELARFDRLVFTLADMPFVHPESLRELARGDGSMFTGHPDGRPGVPAAFPREAYPILAALPDKKGAASVAGAMEWSLLAAGAASLVDVDTPADLDRVAASIRQEPG